MAELSLTRFHVNACGSSYDAMHVVILCSIISVKHRISTIYYIAAKQLTWSMMQSEICFNTHHVHTGNTMKEGQNKQVSKSRTSVKRKWGYRYTNVKQSPT